MCHVRLTSGYHWNIALERLMESIRVPCANAAHCCTAMPAYYDHPPPTSRRALTMSCYCSQADYGFARSTAALLDHFADAHG